MGEPIRVLLCDDSMVMRRLLKAALQFDPQLTVVGEAKDGQDAIDKIAASRPDVVVMDVEMPLIDGIDVVRAIRQRDAKLPIILLSSLHRRGAEATLDALEAGATDFCTKPASVGHLGPAMRHVQHGLIPKIHQWTHAGSIPPQPISYVATPSDASNSPVAESLEDATLPEGQQSLADSQPQDDHPTVIGIGVSTGGPKALAMLLQHLPVDFRVPILIAQHMPPIFTGILARRLAAQKGHHVREAVDGEALQPSAILIAPGDYHLTLKRDDVGVVRTSLTRDEPESTCRPSVNPLFRSMADCYGADCLGIVLTGLGTDGELGARMLKQRGARVLAQDERTSVVWGMPGNVVRLGLADDVLTIDRIVAEMLQVAKKRPAVT